MTALAMSNLEPALKTDYIDGLNDQSNLATVMLNKLNRNHDLTGGNFVQEGHLSRHNPGVGSRGEGGTLPRPGIPTLGKATFPLMTLYGRLRINGKVARASSAQARARLAEAIDVQMASLLTAMPFEHNRMLFNDGSGIIASIATTCANTINLTVDTTQYVAEGDFLSVLNETSGATVLATAVVASISGAVVVIGSAITVTTAHSLFREGSFGQEIFGLESTHSTANPPTAAPTTYFGGLNRATNSWWKGNVLHNSGTNRDLSIGLMQQGYMESYIKGKGVIDFLIAHPDMWITYGGMITPDRRFMATDAQFDAGFQYLVFNGSKFFFDLHCKNNRIYMSELGSLTLWEYEGGYQWRDANGSILQNVAEKDQWEATVLKDTQFTSNHPNRMVKIADLNTNLN